MIAQTGDVLRGGTALFVMSLGMGAPLLIIGTSAGRLLPKAGAWMDTVKKLFGVLMLAVAAWMLARIVPEPYALVLWAIPAFAAAIVIWIDIKPTTWRGWLGRGVAVAFGVYGLVLLAGLALGGRDPLSPIPQWSAPQSTLEFKKIKTVADLDREVAAASAAGKPVMLDFYADWCVSCKEMERYTFTDTNVQSVLEGAVLLKADVTANDEADQALLQRFGIFGPPTIAFWNTEGVELNRFRVVGFMKADEFANVARLAQAPGATP